MYSSERRRDRTIRKETVITEPAMDGSDGCMQRTWRATFLVPLSSVLIRGSRDGCAGGCSPGSVRVPDPGSGPGPDPGLRSGSGPVGHAAVGQRADGSPWRAAPGELALALRTAGL